MSLTARVVARRGRRARRTAARRDDGRDRARTNVERATRATAQNERSDRKGFDRSSRTLIRRDLI
jgi:hypothetical protein